MHQCYLSKSETPSHQWAIEMCRICLGKFTQVTFKLSWHENIYNWLCRQYTSKSMFISDSMWMFLWMCMIVDCCLLSEVLLSVWESFWVCSGNSFPLHQLRHQAAWSSHFSDHTFCPVRCGSDMSGSFVKLNNTYNIPMGFTGLLWGGFDTNLVLSHGLVVCFNVIYQWYKWCRHAPKLWKSILVFVQYQLYSYSILNYAHMFTSALMVLILTLTVGEKYYGQKNLT